MTPRAAWLIHLAAPLFVAGCNDHGDPSDRDRKSTATAPLAAADRETLLRAQSLLAVNPRATYDGLERLLEADPPPPRVQLVAGMAANALGRHVEAADRMQDAVDRDPDLWPRMSPLGAVYLGLGHTDRARRTFESVLDRVPDQARALTGLGQVALEAGDPTTALRHLDRAIAKKPSLISARFQRARALQMDHRDADAQEELERVLAVQPSHAKALYLKSQLLVRAGRIEEAEAVLELRAEAYSLREKVDSMIAHTKSGGGDAGTYAKIVRILLRLEDRAEATRMLRTGIARHPSDAMLRDLDHDLRAANSAADGADGSR